MIIITKFFAPDLEKRQFKIKNCACVIFHIRFYFDPLKLEKVCTESVELNGIMCTLRLKSTYIDPHSCFHFQTQKSIIVHILNDTCFVNCFRDVDSQMCYIRLGVLVTIVASNHGYAKF